MRNSTPTIVLIAATILLAAGWGISAQVQEKAKSNPNQKPASSPKMPDAKNKKGGAPSAKPAAAAAATEEADDAAIRQGAQAFVAAYNAHDSRAVSELFALKAEFTDEEGNLIKGREAIERDFARMFSEFPDCTIEVDIASIRLLTPNIAIEEGSVRGQPIPEEPSNISEYVTIHVKVDGRWLIASVTDYEVDAGESLSPRDSLEQLAWMVGEWIDESPDSSVKSSCRWDDTGSYLLIDFTLQAGDALDANGSMRIGWDPHSGQLKSWTFDADSGYSEGLWTRQDDSWSVRSHGTNGAGQITSATHVYRFIDNDTMTWRSYDRVVSGEPADEVPEFVIKRQAPDPQP
ncbi:MAG: SgcJ/EcaC family oxidoreductase [Planctomycetales bacterium]